MSLIDGIHAAATAFLNASGRKLQQIQLDQVTYLQLCAECLPLWDRYDRGYPAEAPPNPVHSLMIGDIRVIPEL